MEDQFSRVVITLDVEAPHVFDEIGEVDAARRRVVSEICLENTRRRTYEVRGRPEAMR